MDWILFFSVIGTGIVVITVNVTMFLWLRTESSADRRSIQNVLDEMKNEAKDFHGRLCTLEERYLQILQQKSK